MNADGVYNKQYIREKVADRIAQNYVASILMFRDDDLIKNGKSKDI